MSNLVGLISLISDEGINYLKERLESKESFPLEKLKEDIKSVVGQLKFEEKHDFYKFEEKTEDTVIIYTLLITPFYQDSSNKDEQELFDLVKFDDEDYLEYKISIDPEQEIISFKLNTHEIELEESVFTSSKYGLLEQKLKEIKKINILIDRYLANYSDISGFLYTDRPEINYTDPYQKTLLKELGFKEGSDE